MLVFVNINGVQDKDVVVVFGKGDDETLGSNLQATAAGNLNMRALKLSVAERRVLVFLVLLMSVDGDVELVPVGVTNQDVAGVRNVNSVRETSHLLRTDLPQQLTFGGHNYYIVVPEVAHVIIALENTDVTWFFHEVRTLVKPDELSALLEDKNGGCDGVNSHNVTLRIDGKSSDDVDEPD